MSEIRPPAVNPCGSCPYRCDAPSGLWSAEEYEKLPPFDGDIGDQPPTVFMCHQAGDRVCAGWAGCHDMQESLGLRFAVLAERMTMEDYEALLDYATSVPLFRSGAEAAAHGMTDIAQPSLDTLRTARKLEHRLARMYNDNNAGGE